MALHRNRSRSQAVADKACIVGGRKLGRVQAGVLKAMLEMGTFPGTWQWKRPARLAQPWMRWLSVA